MLMRITTGRVDSEVVDHALLIQNRLHVGRSVRPTQSATQLYVPRRAGQRANLEFNVNLFCLY